MSETLARSLNASPPHDLEAERLFCGALFTADQADRNRATMLVKAAAFHDPFHAWFFQGMRQCRDASTVTEVLLFMKYEHPAPEWIRPNFGFWVASLICRRDGILHGGNPRLLASYAERINRLAERRARIAGLESELTKELFDA